ncbi:MAG: rRNA maturation RNase YbeY [Acidobacteriota bacterium]
MAIEVVNRQRLARIDASRVARLADATLGAVGKPGASLTVAFVRDRVMRDLNRKFRASDRATDVLSFPAEPERPGAGDEDFTGDNAPEYLGDIAVSTDTALRQANEAGHSFEREVDELVMHGVVHLCGYDHETDRGEMNRLELKLRRKLLD